MNLPTFRAGPMSGDDDCYTVADIRDVCMAAAEHFDHEALSARRASRHADSAAMRFMLIGKANYANDAATYMRAVGNHQ